MLGPNYLIRVTPELLDSTFVRDAQGRRLSWELGEPDSDGVRDVRITVHADDDLTKNRRCARCAHRRAPDARRDGHRIHLTDYPWCAVACVEIDLDDVWLSITDDFGCEHFEAQK